MLAVAYSKSDPPLRQSPYHSLRKKVTNKRYNETYHFLQRSNKRVLHESLMMRRSHICKVSIVQFFFVLK